jgi:hypothetical protein
MTLLPILFLTLLMLSVHPAAGKGREYRGYAARYGAGKMARVATVRGIPHERCMIAATRERIGTWVRVEGVRTGTVVDCIVVDVVADKDRREVERRGIVVELDHAWAVPVCGSARERPERCPVIVRIK